MDLIAFEAVYIPLHYISKDVSVKEEIQMMYNSALLWEIDEIAGKLLFLWHCSQKCCN